VTRCIIDHAFTIEFADADEKMLLRIEGGFELSDDRLRRISASSPLDMGPAVALFGCKVNAAAASDDGRLQVDFEGGRCLSVAPDENLEAWEFCGPAGARMVCMPGGALAIWQPEGETPTWRHLYVVYRFDHRGLSKGISADRLITIKEIFGSTEEAENEVVRLNALNAEKGCVYAFQSAKYYPKGR